MGDTSEALQGFFDYQWGSTEGTVRISTLDGGGEWLDTFFPWPQRRTYVTDFVLEQNSAGKDTYYAPAIFCKEADAVTRNSRGQMTAHKDNVLGSHQAWVDIDGNAPENWAVSAGEHNIPVPTMVIQSSVSDRHHAYWKLDQFTPRAELEDLNRSLALTLGADKSGWDSPQVLRPPFTVNHGNKNAEEKKPWFNGESLPVTLLGVVQEKYSIEKFSALAKVRTQIMEKLLNLGDIPAIEHVMAMERWTPALFESFSLTRDEAATRSPDGRSGTLQRLMYDAAEAGFTDEQMYAVIDHADKRWEKYTNRAPGVRDEYLHKTIMKARERKGYLTEEDLTFPGWLANGENVEEAPTVVWGLEEFMAADVQIEWMLEDLHPVNGIGVTTGQPGTGKTQFVTQIGLSLALGKGILGFNNCVGPQKVLLLSLEMDHAPYKHFLEKMLRQYESEIRNLYKNVNVYAVNTMHPLDTEPGKAFFESILTRYKPDVVIVDSFSKLIAKEMTDEVGVKAVMDSLAKIRAKHNCSIIAVHHDRKQLGDITKRGPGSLSDMYGNQYFSAGLDWVISMQKTETKGTLQLANWKNRLSEEFDPFCIIRNANLQYDRKEDEDIVANIGEGFGGATGFGFGNPVSPDTVVFGTSSN